MSDLVEFAAHHSEQLKDLVSRPICELELVVRCATITTDRPAPICSHHALHA